MTQHDPLVPMRHMLDAAREASALIAGISQTDLIDNRVLTLAVVHLLEVIGEAANRVPQDVRAVHPQVPWPQIVGLRNRLVHGYDQIDMDVVWNILTQDLRPLISTLEQIIPSD